MSLPVTPPPAAALGQRTVLVTGAAKLLGREIALTLARAGWRVAVHYRDSVEEARKTVADCSKWCGGSASFRANLGNETAVRNLLPGVIEAMGQVDAIVNSASTFELDTPATFSFAAMEKHMRANTGAAILLSQSLHAHLLTREGASGAVVNLLDQKLWNPNPDFTSYTLSKAALESAGAMLALALAPRVRVVGVASGLLPLGRMSTASDVAATVAFALENQSITGATLLVDGGQHLVKFEQKVAPL
ncbi:MAG: SDR family NAD(P)-dependent oxidoreductase [Polaromonas sp.]|nr:SDR family NAD(P)-dependent oxidoreductase [Polaromonas sp.]